jgi:sporulation protein YlmC with PRC-barrel domain
MKKLYWLLTVFVAAAMVLAACEPADEPPPPDAPPPPGVETPPPDEPPPPGVETPPPVEPTPPPVEDPPPPVEETPPPDVEPTPEPVGLQDEARLSELIGYDIVNPEGETLGNVDEFLVDRNTGEIHLVVARTGGFLGIGARSVLVPWEAMELTHEPGTEPMAEDPNLVFVMNVDEETFANAPDVDMADWPGVPFQEWDEASRAYWADHIEVLPVTGEPQAQPQDLIRLTRVTGMDVRAHMPPPEGQEQDERGEDIGNVEEMIVDHQEGRITYVVVDTSAFLEREDNLLLLPWNALQWDEEHEWFVLHPEIDAAALEGAPGYTDIDEIPRTDEPEWDAENRQYWEPIVPAQPEPTQ